MFSLVVSCLKFIKVKKVTFQQHHKLHPPEWSCCWIHTSLKHQKLNIITENWKASTDFIFSILCFSAADILTCGRRRSWSCEWSPHWTTECRKLSHNMFTPCRHVFQWDGDYCGLNIAEPILKNRLRDNSPCDVWVIQGWKHFSSTHSTPRIHCRWHVSTNNDHAHMTSYTHVHYTKQDIQKWSLCCQLFMHMWLFHTISF